MGIEDTGNRNCYDIIADILTACSTPIRKTPLMSRASASKITLDKILKLCLIEPSLVQKIPIEEGSNVYLITELGKEYLQAYSDLMQILKTKRSHETAPIPLIRS